LFEEPQVLFFESGFLADENFLLSDNFIIFAPVLVVQVSVFVFMFFVWRVVRNGGSLFLGNGDGEKMGISGRLCPTGKEASAPFTGFAFLAKAVFVSLHCPRPKGRGYFLWDFEGFEGREN
jgi:hypothetical protein